jgi:copper(I)-binding protein
VSRSVSPTRVVIAVGAVVGAFALAGCGAGQITQTSSQQSGVDGASANVGQIAVRAAEFPFAGNGSTAVVYPSGGTAPLSMTVANIGGTADKLTKASSPVAASVNITGDGTISAGKLLLVEGAPAAPAPPVAASGSARPRASAGASATPQATPSASAAPAAPTAATVPTTTAVSTVEPTAEAGSTATAGASAPPTSVSPVGTTSAQVVLTGLKEDLKAGLTYPVVLTFQQAGDVTVQVPIGNPSEGSAAG